MLLLRQASIIPMKKKHKAILFWIDEAHVSPAQGLHAVVYTMSLCWGEQEVDMVCHQYIGKYLDAIFI